MTGKVTPMDTRLIAALATDLEDLNVSDVCRDHGISRTGRKPRAECFEVTMMRPPVWSADSSPLALW